MEIGFFLKKKNFTHLTIVSSEVEVDSLRGCPVPPAVAGCECNTDNPSTVPGSQPALLIVALPTHGLLLLALGHSALPRQAEDVGVAAEDRSMLHRGEHSCRVGDRNSTPVDKIYPGGSDSIEV